jgi:hypothetical protein
MRANTSITKATNTKPRQVATQGSLGRLAVKSRFTRFNWLSPLAR